MPDDELAVQVSYSINDQPWRTYFKAIGIKERMNPRKQPQDMPRRYWRCLTEKMA